MGYTIYWRQSRAFSAAEWKVILGETKRIIGKASRGLYSGAEDSASQNNVVVEEMGFRHGFNEKGPWRTFPNPEAPIPQQGVPIFIAGPRGRGKPQLTKEFIALNGKARMTMSPSSSVGYLPSFAPTERVGDLPSVFVRLSIGLMTQLLSRS